MKKPRFRIRTFHVIERRRQRGGWESTMLTYRNLRKAQAWVRRQGQKS